MKIGKQIKEAREYKEWSMDELGNRAGVTATCIMNIEANKNTTIKTLTLLAKALGKNLVVKLAKK